MQREFICGDCMNFLPDFPDNYFDVAVVDPPYFSGPEKRGFYGRKISPIGVQRIYKVSEQWNIPNQEYFDQLFRVSKNQIVWAAIILNTASHQEELYGISAMGIQAFPIVR